MAFLTDCHVPSPKSEDRSKLRPQERMTQAFTSANAEKPDLFVFGGDNVMSVDHGIDEAAALEQFENWRELRQKNVAVPCAHVIGNHDIWRPKDRTTEDPKALAVEYFAMPHRFYRTDYRGWSFFLLDVFHPGAPTEIDEEQWSWLASELANASRPACIVTHTPIFSVSNIVEGGGVGKPKQIRELFLKHENVRLALSGHQHHIDRCEYDRVTYICGGAVSGAWWGGNYAHFPPAYVILDLWPDGRVESRVRYWETLPGEPPIVSPPDAFSAGSRRPHPAV
ncbi:MAG: metallophosphoesterase [Fimbriimonadaceae bacterium]